MKQLRTLFLATVLLWSAGCARNDPGSPSDTRSVTTMQETKPFRVLVVIGDQWTDPFSYNIDTRRVRGREFTDVVSMLKVWGVPFDILRLDEQRLQINRFLDGMAKPKYGSIIWMADPEKLEGSSAHYPDVKKSG